MKNSLLGFLTEEFLQVSNLASLHQFQMESKHNLTPTQSQIYSIKALLFYLGDCDEVLYVTALIGSRYHEYAIFINYKQWQNS